MTVDASTDAMTASFEADEECVKGPAKGVAGQIAPPNPHGAVAVRRELPPDVLGVA